MKNLSNVVLSIFLLGCTVYSYGANTATAKPTTMPQPPATVQKVTDPIEAYNLGHYDDALKALKPEAEKGNPVAQFYVGAMYYNGQGVQKDYAAAYMWMTLSKEAGNHLGIEGLKSVESKMNASQITKGKEAVTSWKAAHQPSSK